MVSNFMKQAKVRPFQDNRRNMVNKLEKGSIHKSSECGKL
jgi:hypothetical protein